MNLTVDKMEKWEHDRPTFADDKNKNLKQLLKECKSIRELTEKLGYDPDVYEVDLGETVSEKNLKSNIVIVRDKMANNPEMKRQYKEFLKKKRKSTKQQREKMKFEYIPQKENVKKKTSRKKVKRPKCFGTNVLGSYKCNSCASYIVCEKEVKKDN